MTEPLLTVDDLITEFRTENGTTRPVDGVSLSVREGEVLGLVGESGSGKTITALSIMGLIEGSGHIAGGRFLFDGQDLRAMKRRDLVRLRGDRMSMIFQQPRASLNPVMPVGLQVAELFERHRGMSRTGALEQAETLFHDVGIPAPAKKLKAYPHELSGGQAQRVMIAMALALKPRLLIADEPTTALDVTIQAQILKLLRKLCRETGTAMILVTHDLGVIAQTADRIAVMYAGQIVETAATGPLFDAPGHPYTRALMRSMPARGKRQEKLQSIPGTVPSPHRMPAACRFAPRCELRREAGLTRCTQEAPPLIGLPGGGAARCWALETRKEPA